ncbi:MAG: hydroxyacid dehydrogenase [Nanoarchaeota archaeon]|nr:hydroxyacid dehydrogenase [Nanoarchaeota archaeon]
MKILVVEKDKIHPDGLKLLEQKGHNITSCSAQDLPTRDLETTQVLLTSVTGLLTRGIIEKATGLQAIISASVGLDHIDQEACKEHNIPVFHAPGSNANAVATHTIALLFAVLRKVAAADAHVRQGKWNREQYFGQDLDNKVLGLVGFGHIGRQVAKRLSGFAISVIVYDPLLTKEQVEQHPDLKGIPVKKVDALEVLLKAADIISIHVPLLESTRNLINKKEFAVMKPTTILLNTSRGPVVNEAALLDALKHRIYGAGLDVFDKEPTINPAFFALENVVVTPHIAAMTTDARRAMGIEAVKAFLRSF